MNRVCTFGFINDFVFLRDAPWHVCTRMYVYDGYIVVYCGGFGVALDEEAEHRVVAMGVPARQEDDMFALCVHYLMSMISASG